MKGDKKMTTLKSLKKGEFFTKKQIENPTDSQVWVRGDYDRAEKKYECVRFDDANKFCYMTGSKEVFTDFVF